MPVSPSSVTATLSEHALPCQIIEVDISAPMSGISAHGSDTHIYCSLALLVRCAAYPLGLILCEQQTAMTPEQVATTIWKHLQHQIRTFVVNQTGTIIESLPVEGVPIAQASYFLTRRAALLQNAPLVSVIIATRDRPDVLGTCLDSVLACDYPHFEIIIVDNAPRTSATADFIAVRYGNDRRVRYVHEPRPGLSWARNRGIAEAQGSILAYTDDDVVVDSHWITALVDAFAAHPNVACVTGLTLPAELMTNAQLWFEQFGGFSKGFAPQLYNNRQYRPRFRQQRIFYPFSAGIFGSGNNMAFTAAFLHEVGGFDPALGAGTPTHGGEDLLIYFQTITRGYTLVYEPSAMNHHAHRRDYAGLARQMYGYGTGLSSYLLRALLEKPAYSIRLLLCIPYGLFCLFSSSSERHQRKSSDYPHELTRLEQRGFFMGPFAYLHSYYNARRIQQRFQRTEVASWSS